MTSSPSIQSQPTVFAKVIFHTNQANKKQTVEKEDVETVKDNSPLQKLNVVQEEPIYWEMDTDKALIGLAISLLILLTCILPLELTFLHFPFCSLIITALIGLTVAGLSD